MILNALFISSLLTLLIFFYARISAAFLDKSNVFNKNFYFISLILSIIGFGYTFLYCIKDSQIKYLIYIMIFPMWILLYTKLLNLSLQIIFNNRFKTYINLLCITFIAIVVSIAFLSESTQGMKFINTLQTMYFCITGVISVIYFKAYNKRKSYGVLQQKLFNSVYRAYVIMFIADLCNRWTLLRTQTYFVLVTQCIYAGWVIFTLYYLNKYKLEELNFLCYHDGLTGLYNRVYFKRYMKEFSMDSGQLCCIMICDIDNLKLINDTLGHEAGDELIFMASKLIKSSLEPGDMLARIGGDEFVIIIKCGMEQEGKARYIKLVNTIKNHNSIMPKIPISISIGMAYKEEDFRLMDLFKEADDNMYRNKLKQSIEAKAIMIDSITNSLITRDFIYNGHANRVRQLSEELGKSLGLTSNKIKKLKMLARYHDIGKVGISEEILYKPDKLTLEETFEVKRHCEIGYRIAKSTQKLQPIAELILKHHERWDGTGYPLRLKGEEIPIECRIIAIADSFDVMVSGRPYKKPMSQDEAIEEIVRESGKQFDPKLVEKFMNLYIKDKFIYKNTMSNVINMDIEPKGVLR